MIFQVRTILDDGSVQVTDDRDFAACRDAAMERLRADCEAAILAAAPEYRQRNAALGLLSAEETAQVRDAIAACRAEYERCKSFIIGTQWDGTEATRAACCDAVQSVRFDL